MAWATADDVYTVTGKEASPEALALAQTIVELFSGTTEEASDNGDILSKNLRYLRNAVAFQAVWLDAHPDVLEAMDVEGVSQDGLSATYANANAHLLAPLAKRFLDRLSWKTQGIRIKRARHGQASTRGNRDSAVADDQYEWTPLPFGHTP
jgi:hypothetical protein